MPPHPCANNTGPEPQPQLHVGTTTREPLGRQHTPAVRRCVGEGRGPAAGAQCRPARLTMREASSSSSRLACRTPCGSPSMRIRLLFSLSGGMRTDTLHWSLILFTEDTDGTLDAGPPGPNPATVPQGSRATRPSRAPRGAGDDPTQRDHTPVPPWELFMPRVRAPQPPRHSWVGHGWGVSNVDREHFGNSYSSLKKNILSKRYNKKTSHENPEDSTLPEEHPH